MITIEILISILILFLVITTSVTMIKQLRIVENKGNKYEKFYIAFNNVASYLENTICTQRYLKQKGVLSSVSYTATCKLISQQKNYKKAYDIGEPEGNIGNILLSFYEINLELKWQTKYKTFKYYKTIAKKSK